VLIKHNWFAPNRVSVSEIANPRDFIAVNILKDDRRSPRFYVPGVIIAASAVIKHDHHRESTLMIFWVVMILATVTSGTMPRPAPLMIVRIVISIVLMIVAIFPIVVVRPIVVVCPIVAVCPIASIRPVSMPIVPIRPTMVTVGSPIITIGSTIVVRSMARVAATIIGWVSGVVLIV